MQLPRSGRAPWLRLLLLLAGFCLSALRGPAEPVAAPPHVLVLVSYHPGYSWTDGELQGVLRVLSRRNHGLIPSVEFLDAKRDAAASRLDLRLAFIREKYRDQPFDLIVALDDPALQFALRHREVLGARTPIVFGGINDFSPEVLRGQTGITGVPEAFDFSGNLDLILRLRPGTRVVHVVSDTSASTVATRAAFERVAIRYAGRLEFRHVTNWTADELPARLAALPAADAALILGDARDAAGRLVSEDEAFLEEIPARSAVPVFMLSQPFLPVTKGYDWNLAVWFGLGGRLLSSDTHGEAVGALAARILAGESADSIPVAPASPTRCAFDYPQLLRHNIDPALLPPGAELFNRPVTFYEQYRAWILATLSVILLLGAAVAVLGLNTVRRRRAERALLRANERFELVAPATNDAVWDLDLASGAMWWNDNFARMVRLPGGRSPARDTWLEVVHPDDRALVAARLESPPDGDADALEHRFLRPDGGTGHTLLRVYFLRDRSGRPVRAVGSMLDITERKRTEKRLRTLATAVEQARDSVVVLDASGLVEYANPAFVRATGISAEALHGRPYDFFRASAEPAVTFDRVAHVVAARGQWTDQMTCRGTGGKPVLLQVVVSAIRDAGGGLAGYLMLARDITIEAKLEEQVRLAQKMDAIGVLAGGITHDFNNLLQIISGNCALAGEPAMTFDEVRELLGEIREAARRAEQLTRQLLVFGRRQAMQVEDVDLQVLAEDLLKLVRRLIGEDIRVSFTCAAPPANVRGDKGQLEQVLMNLCVNARDAMPAGGHLDITVADVVFDEAFCATHAWARPGSFVRVTVADTGCGMDEGTLARIFDPFYTTKPTGKGTGLGLSVVFGIVQQHGGFIRVESAPEAGTRFALHLPTSPRLGGSGEPAAETAPVTTGAGTVLLVEDDDSVRALSQRILTQAGYTVLVARDGGEGVSLARQHLAEIRIVVLDAVMPGLSGMDVYAQVSPLRADLPFLFCSGYSAEVLPLDLSSLPHVRRLQKPFPPARLLREVGEMLAAAAK